MATDAPLIGRLVAGRFRIASVIGEGAMATVYRGTQDAEPHDVAVKIMHSHLAGDATFARRFRREAKAAARLRHPKTVSIVDYGVDDGLVYIVMELLAGRDLFELLIRERRLSGGHAARIMLEVCDALAAAHEHGIVHRDLKPENVMLVTDPRSPDVLRVKVLDFGIAKILERQSYLEDAPTSVTGSGLTNVGAVLGTPEYMSPEQCQGSVLDFRTDIYSAGVLLYQLVTGQVPFSGESPVHTMLKHVREPPPPPRSLTPDLHPALEAVILRALSKRVADRYQTTLELWDALAGALLEIDPRATIEPPKQAELAMSGAFPSSAPPPDPSDPGLPSPFVAPAQRFDPHPSYQPPGPHAPPGSLPPSAHAPPHAHGFFGTPPGVPSRPDGTPPAPTLAFYAVTFAIAFLVVLIILLMIVFRTPT